MAQAPPGLPAGFAEPLHILDPGEGSIWQWVALAVMLLAVTAVVVALLRRWWRWWRWWRKRPSTPPAPRSEPTVIGARIDEIQDRYNTAAGRREGCHLLSILLREQLERRRGQPFTHMTARESQQPLGHSAASRCLLTLSRLRFGRGEPSAAAFSTACDQVRAVEGVTSRAR